MKLDIDAQACCEECGEIYHNHMECPVCKKYTGTEQYGPLGEDGPPTEVSCEECHTVWTTSGSPYFDAEWVQAEAM